MTVDDINKKECCGCSLCATVCVKRCITMTPDAEGFLFPIINKDECINCGICYKKCPVTKGVETNTDPYYFAAAISNKEDLFNSSSGGIFIALAKHILKLGG